MSPRKGRALQNAAKAAEKPKGKGPVTGRISKAKLEYIVLGAVVRCDKGSHVQNINLPESHGNYINGRAQFYKEDNKYPENIPCFGVCYSSANQSNEVVSYQAQMGDGIVTGKPCKPNIADSWIKAAPKVMIWDKEALTTESYLFCAQGNTFIRFKTSGQDAGAPIPIPVVVEEKAEDEMFDEEAFNAEKPLSEITASIEAAEFIAEWEGLPKEQYLIRDENNEIIGIKPFDIGDGGTTYGYGHHVPYGKNLDTELAETMKKGYLTTEEANLLFIRDSEINAEDLKKDLRAINITSIKQREFDSLLSIKYNSPGTIKKLVEAIDEDQKDRSNFENIIEAYIQKHTSEKFRQGVKRRRIAEMDVFFEGDYSGRP